MHRGSKAALLLALVWPALALGAQAPAAPKPELTVALERSALRAGDSVPLEVWLANPSEAPLTGLRLDLRGPDFIRLAERPAAGCRSTARGAATLPLGDLGPRQLASRRLCLQIGDRGVREDDFDLLFVVPYHWQAAGAAYVAAVKPVKVGLLGTETIAGFSLRLVIFLLPGALLLMPLRITGFPGIASLSALEYTLASLGLSAALGRLVAWLDPKDFGSGVSFDQLVSLSAIGFGCGLLAGLVWLGARRLRALEQQGSVVQVADGADEVIRKLLRAAPRPPGRVLAEQGGQRYVGSCWVKATDGIVLGGWFEIVGADAEARRQLEELARQGRWGAMHDLARRRGLTIGRRDAVQRLVDAGLESANQSFLRLPGEGIAIGTAAEGPDGPPISLA
jgi:hypothetical protein